MLGSDIDIWRQLIAEGKSVRALAWSTSDSARVERLKSLGAEIFQGDVRHRDPLDRACNSVTAVIATIVMPQQPLQRLPVWWASWDLTSQGWFIATSGFRGEQALGSAFSVLWQTTHDCDGNREYFFHTP